MHSFIKKNYGKSFQAMAWPTFFEWVASKLLEHQCNIWSTLQPKIWGPWTQCPQTQSHQPARHDWNKVFDSLRVIYFLMYWSYLYLIKRINMFFFSVDNVQVRVAPEERRLYIDCDVEVRVFLGGEKAYQAVEKVLANALRWDPKKKWCCTIRKL